MTSKYVYIPSPEYVALMETAQRCKSKLRDLTSHKMTNLRLLALVCTIKERVSCSMHWLVTATTALSLCQIAEKLLSRRKSNEGILCMLIHQA